MSRSVPDLPPLMFEETRALVGPVHTRVLQNTVRIGTPPLGRGPWREMAQGCNWLMGGGAMQLASWGRTKTAIAASGSKVFHSYTWPRPQCRARYWSIVTIDSAGAKGVFVTDDSPSGKPFAVPGNGLHVLRFYELRTAVDDTGEAITNTLTLDADSTSMRIVSASVAELPPVYVGVAGSGERGIEVDSCGKGNLIYMSEDPAPTEEMRSVDGVIRTLASLSSYGQGVIRRAMMFDWFLDSGIATTSTSFVNIFHSPPQIQGRQLFGDTTRTVNWAVYAAASASAGQVRVTSSVDASTSTLSITSATPAWYTGTLTVEADDVDEDGWVRDSETLTFARRATSGNCTVYGIKVGE
jgi:hypothetical protein